MKILLVDVVNREKLHLECTKFQMKKILKKIKKNQVELADTDLIADIEFNMRFATFGLSQELYDDLKKRASS